MQNIQKMIQFADIFRTPGCEDLKIKKLSTGILSLDESLNGGFTAGVHTVCATPGGGKTTFALNLAVNCAKGAIPAIIFSYEMPAIDVITKIYSCVSATLFENDAFTFDDIRCERTWTSAEKKKYLKLCDFVEKEIMNKIMIVDCITSPLTVLEIANIVDKFVAENGQTPFVIIDYLQMICPEKEHLSAKNNAENAMSVLHMLAEKYQMPILAISSIAKQSSDTLTLFSAAEAARIAYASVTVIGLSDAKKSLKTDDISFKKITLSIFKNRYGVSDVSLRLAFDGEHSRFLEVPSGKKKSSASKKETK